MDGHRFDALTRTLIAVAPSRRRLAGGFAAAALAALLPGSREAAAGRRCRKGNYCRSDLPPICDLANECVCYKRSDGGRVCAAAFGECVGCRRDRDCRDVGLPGFRCVENGGNCCGNRPKSVCAAPSGALPPCDGLICDDACCEFEQACVGDPGACVACPAGSNLCDGNPVSCDPFGECFCVTSIEDVAVCSSMFGFCADCDSDDQCSFALGEQAVCIPAPDCCGDLGATRACVPATCFGGGPDLRRRATSTPLRRLRPAGFVADQPRRRWSARRPAGPTR